MRVGLLLLTAFALSCGASVSAATNLNPSPQNGSQPGTIEGCIVDATTGEALPGATVRIRDTERGRAADSDGCFLFEEVEPGTYRLVAQFLGFQSQELTVRVEDGEHVELTFELTPSSLDLPDVVITGFARERGAADVYRPTSVVSGQELHRRLDMNVPETLSRVPGFASQYNAPGATRPVIRGMGGDRVLMLEDGQRTGDLYQTSADHGVMVEAVTAERIEVVRGPAGLLYGSKALGGVVNVIRNEIPRSLPSELTGTFTSQIESVNRGGSGGAMLLAPVGALAVRGEVSYRNAGDTHTPEGPLPSSDIRVFNGSLGASWARDWGHVGASYRFYDNLYGVPGSFNGEVIPGAHPEGIDIQARRHVGRFRIAYEEGAGFFENIELDGNLTQYLHNEIEARVGGEPVYGTRFSQLSGEANLMASHHHENGAYEAEGSAGASFHGRALTAGGTSSGSRSGDEWAVAVFGYEELGRGPLRVQVGARYDYRSITPRDTSPIEINTQDRDIVKPVSARSFGAFSGSIAALYTIAEVWTVGTSLTRSFRNPTLEELYSDGPHLADFSFDIGSPDLDSEFGLGLDVFVRASGSRLSMELAGFFNRVSNYIYYRPTGENIRVWRVDDDGNPTSTEVPVFEASGDDADFLGFEARVQWEPISSVVLDATTSYVRATRRSEGDPLPAIPPLSGSLEIRYENEPFFANLGVDASAPQERVPEPIQRGDELAFPERPTDGYGLLNAGIGYRYRGSTFVHTLSLQANNLTNEVWRDHLSRMKDVAPQPGRNLRLTYRVQF